MLFYPFSKEFILLCYHLFPQNRRHFIKLDVTVDLWPRKTPAYRGKVIDPEWSAVAVTFLGSSNIVADIVLPNTDKVSFIQSSEIELTHSLFIIRSSIALTVSARHYVVLIQWTFLEKVRYACKSSKMYL